MRPCATVAMGLGACMLAATALAAPPSSDIRGATTTQGGTVLLPGVEVTIGAVGADHPAGVVVSDALGRYRVGPLPAGRYVVIGRLAGFSDRVVGPVEVNGTTDVEVPLDLDLAPVSETVRVVGEAGIAETRAGESRDTVSAQLLDVLPVVGASYRALLPVLPGVVRQADGRVSLKGARPTQGGLQLGRESGLDPSTGNFGIELPADSVDSVEVSANPYSAEDGRFSSSIVRIETKAGTNQWRFAANGLVPFPCLKICDGGSTGFGNYQPRAWIGGPLVKDRLFLSQGVQYRWLRSRVSSLPEGANQSLTESFDAFTRIDASLGRGQTLRGSLAVFPRRATNVNLNTFNPPEVSPDTRLRGYSVSLADSAPLSGSSVVESSLAASLYHSGVSASGDAAMEITPEGNRGSYFNTQDRRTRVLQWTESLTTMRRATGEHLVKVGADLFRASYTGTSESRPALIRRADGTVSQRIDFGPPTRQDVAGTDLAFFAQDRWRPVTALVLEPGLRLDRDGVLGRWNMSTRFSVAIAALSGDRSVIRGGVGTFFERTPLNIGAFGSLETATVTRFGPDGASPAGTPLTYVHRAGALETPRALVWNLEYDHRLGSLVVVKVGHLRRRGSREATLQPLEAGRSAELLLDSTGRSRYVETEATVRIGPDETRQLSVSYVRARSRGNLNAYDLFFGNIRTPVVRPDEYGRAPVDVPNRLLVRGTWAVRQKWTVATTAEIRNGFPYSVVDEDQDFVGARNTGGRFPNLFSWDLTVLRRASVKGRPVRFGVRVGHLLDNFSPRDVQNNTGSPAFRTFSNSLPRRVILTFQFVAR